MNLEQPIEINKFQEKSIDRTFSIAPMLDWFDF